MSLILSHSADIATCTKHDDCKECRELADSCFKVEHGRDAGMVEIREWNREYMAPGAVEIAVLFRDGEYQGRKYRTFEALTESYVGRVVAFETRCERVMSDVWEDITYAWCAEKDGSFTMRVAHRNDCGETGRYTMIDASDELVGEWHAWMARKEDERRENERLAAEKRAKEMAEQEARTPRKGKTVRVVKGRKVPVGVVGKCVWMGEGKYGRRVGIKVEGQEEPVWTAASNVEVVQEVASETEVAA